MSRKLIIAMIVSIALMIIAVPVLAGGAKNGTYLAWSSGGEKSGYFMTTASGIVHFWSYDRPDGTDVHFIAKPLDKYPNATQCDAGFYHEKLGWTPRPLYNAMYSQYKPTYLTFFADLDLPYLLCGYEIE
jgi:hypothetical protein